MSDIEPRDRIASEAARLYHTGKAASIRAAIEAAVKRLGIAGGALPGEGRVRQHLQAMNMQAMGEASYLANVQTILTVAEQFMTAMEELAGVESLLVGRAARGQVDGPTSLHVRLYTTLPIEAIADRLEQLGYSDLVHETRNSPHGRLNRILLIEDGVELVITRCLPRMRPAADRNLYTAAPVETADLRAVREMIERAGREE